MIEETARVIAVEDGRALVETERRSACGSCSAGRGCGTALIGRFFGNRTARLSALNGIQAAPGDRVVIGLDESGLLRASLAIYLAPLAGLIGGSLMLTLAAQAVGAGAGEPAGVLGGLLGLVGGLAWARGFGLRAGGDARYQAVILRSAPDFAVSVDAVSRI